MISFKLFETFEKTDFNNTKLVESSPETIQKRFFSLIRYIELVNFFFFKV